MPRHRAKDPPKEAPKSPRETPLKSKDEGKFFSEEAWAKVNAAAEKLLKEKGLDLQIETFATPPKLDAEKVKAMSRDERTKFFREYAQEHVKANKIVRAHHHHQQEPGIAVRRSGRGRKGEDSR
ncbi:MAG: hypothetical protein U0792_25255 [Gemmataceae bacterium]